MVTRCAEQRIDNTYESSEKYGANTIGTTLTPVRAIKRNPPMKSKA